MTTHNDATHPVPTSAQAQSMLAAADQASERARRHARLPYVVFPIALAAATSLGTFGMAMTTGDAFGACYVSTLVVALGLILAFSSAIVGRSAYARSRRWTIIMAAWTVSYLGAIAVVVFAHGAIIPAAAASSLILAVGIVSGTTEGRR